MLKDIAAVRENNMRGFASSQCQPIKRHKRVSMDFRLRSATGSYWDIIYKPRKSSDPLRTQQEFLADFRSILKKQSEKERQSVQQNPILFLDERFGNEWFVPFARGHGVLVS